MATSLLPWNSSNEKTCRVGGEGELEHKIMEEQETRSETSVKQRGRKNGKSNGSSQKKQPQRGLGVAQLERLRLQERWKKITEIDQIPSQNPYHQFQFPFIDQPNGVSVPTIARFGPANYGGLNDAQSSSQQALGFHPYRLGNSGFNSSGRASGMRAILPDQFHTDRYRIAAQETRFQSENLFETEKELTSIQKMHCLSDQCEICVKKKRINAENLGYNGGRGKYSGTMQIDGCDFLALNLGRNRTIDGESRDFGVRGASHAGYPGPNVDEEVEVVAIHRKGNSVGGNVLMEYEFIPGSSNKESSSPAEASAGPVFSEASPPTTATNFIDLSLKLSC
ncbi:hypothetical protein HHK36_002014 [Tetracentron sinense]|uniref:Uncharacterized protein n=1 Tax=Tetracentron sinense TaxID=13715 RepID=A0A835DS37_TETSI|nr:hypothetical protein HHK36_002014 [Tetracentron sinense]